MSLLKQFLEEELSLHAELVRIGQGDSMGVKRISEAVLDMVLDRMIEMMVPDQHKNRENRKYNKFFRHAAEAAGQILQCFRNLSDPLVDAGAGGRAGGGSGGGEEFSKEEAKLLGKIKEIAKSAASDQLVTALGGICSGYQRAGKLLYKYAKDHLCMQGMLLNSVQQVLISYTTCLLKDLEAAGAGGGAAMGDEDSEVRPEELAGKELVTQLLPHLHMWLKRPDPKTQQLTLQLLTGRDMAVREERDPAGAPRACRGLLVFIDKDTFANDHEAAGGSGKARGSGLMACIRGMWPSFTSTSCVKELRHAFYCFLQDICDQKVFWDPLTENILGELRSMLVVGLSDADDEVRQSVFDWWNSRGLKADPHERVAEVFRMRPPPKLASAQSPTVDEVWLENSVALLLQLCRDSSSNAKLLFNQDLAYEHRVHFQKRDISTASLTSGSLPMSVPMFASSLPFSLAASSQSPSLYGGSQSQRSLGGGGAGGGDLMATLAGGSQDGGTMRMTLDGDSGNEPNQTLQANDTALYVPRRKVMARPAAAGLQRAQQRRGAFALPRPKASISKAAAEDAERERHARLAESRRAVALRTKQTTARKVTMARQYRAGEIPDIQIKLHDVVKPLQELALRDSVVSKSLLDALFKAVLALKGKEKEAQAMKDAIKPEIIMLLRMASSSDLIGAVLSLAQTADFLGGEERIQANVITAACKRAHAFYDGVKALESQAAQPLSCPAPVEPKGKRLSLSNPREKRKHGGSSRKDSHMVCPPPPLNGYLGV